LGSSCISVGRAVWLSSISNSLDIGSELFEGV
jgi:hypothetical protein